MADDPQQMIKPSPRMTGSPRSKKFLKYKELLDAADTPEKWLIGEFGAFFKAAHLTQEEAIVAQINYCLITNTRFVNSALLKEMLDRKLGKVPLRVLTRPEETPEEFEALTDEEYEARKKQLLGTLGEGDGKNTEES